jgi:plasmid stabilization system protein ParE
MSVTVVVTAEAEADIDEAAQQYEQRSAGLGVDFVARVRDALAAVGANPNLYGEVDDGIRRAPTKRFPYGVFYRRRGDRVVVIAVLHNRRDPSIWQART